MEILVKIILFLCPCSSVIGLHLLPQSTKTPADIALEFNTINKNVFNDNPTINWPDKPRSDEQCFCLPSSKNEPVTNMLGPQDHSLERLVVYLYRKDGLLQVFIPNKQTQQAIPDLRYDIMDGDILKPLFMETVVEIFENNPSIITQQPQIQIEYAEDETHTIDTNLSIESQAMFIDRNPSTDTESRNIETIVDENPNVDMNLLLPTRPMNEISFETNDNLETVDEQNDVNVDLSILSVPDPFVNQEFENVNVGNDLDQVISYAPPTSDNVIESYVPRIETSHLDISEINKNLKFDDWFTDQLSRVLLHNLMSQSNINELRYNIKEVLKNNGMFLSRKGYLFDSDGNIIKMSNIKLRPILIGEPVEYHNLDQFGNSNAAPAEVSYNQIMLIISIDPPQILGVVPMGKIYIPRELNRRRKIDYSNQVHENQHSLKISPDIRCKKCKRRGTHNHREFGSSMKGFPYIELPLRRSFDSGDAQMLLRSLSKILNNIYPSQERRTNNDYQNNFGGMIQKIMSILNPTTLFGGQSRRLIDGHHIVKKDKADPDKYPTDDLPGFRIIGGNAATSSGTPLVSKGRSGYVRPFLFNSD